MNTKIYVAHGRQNRFNQLKDYAEVKLSRFNYKIQNFVKIAQKKWKGIT